MSSYIEQSLSQDEKIEQKFKLHWVMWLSCYYVSICGLAITALAFIYQEQLAKADLSHLKISLATLCITAITVQAINLLLQSQDHGVTNRRVIQKKGLIARNTSEISLKALETVEIKQSILGRILGYGNVVITGRGAAIILFKGLKSPLEVKRAIENVAHKATSPSDSATKDTN